MGRSDRPFGRSTGWLAALLACLPTAALAQPSSFDTLIQGAQRVLGDLPELRTATEGPATGRESLPAPAESGPRFNLPVAVAGGTQPVEVLSENGLISLSVRDASLRQVLAALAETQGLNLIIAAPAADPVTAEFKRMPFQQVLQTLLASTGHTWAEREGVIVVTDVESGGSLSPDMQGRRVAMIELDFASAADLQPIVDGLLSSVGQSHFVEINPIDNRRTKEVLIVEDLDPYVARIERYVAEADQAPRQVLIEVNLLQVELDDDQRCGVDFRAINRVSGARLTMGTSGLAGAYNYQNGGPGFFIESTEGDLDSVIDCLISTTDAKSLASPRLLAVNGQESEIQIGERLGYRVTTTTQTSSLESVEFLEVGVVLTMTPRITRDGRVLLRVSPKVSTGAINPDTGVPDEETTELHTDALLSSGQGMVIGGLIQERDDIRINRVPWLGSLPYINPLFQRRQVEKRRSELIVAIVPHVMPFSPDAQARNEEEVFRASERLLTGALCRNPRPYEPRLYDPYWDEDRLHCFDRTDPFCETCVPGSTGGPACVDPIGGAVTPVEEFVVPVEPEPTLAGPRRLPATVGAPDAGSEPELKNPADPDSPVFEVARRPFSWLIR